MKSDLAKVLHPVCGVPMLTYSIAAARAAGAGKIVVVIGHQAGRIRELFDKDDLIFVEQREQLGTGHAVLQAGKTFRDYDGTIVILCGDVPLIRPETVRALYDRHRSEGATVTVLTTIRPSPPVTAGWSRQTTAGPEDRRRQGCYAGREDDPRDQYRDLLRGESLSSSCGRRSRQPERPEGILSDRYCRNCTARTACG